MRCTANDGTTRDSRPADCIADELEVYGVRCRGHFVPLRLKEFQTSSDVDNKVHLTGSITRKKQAAGASGAAFACAQLGEDKRLLDGTRPARLMQGLDRPHIEQSAEKASVREVELGALDDGLCAIGEPGLQEHHLPGRLEHREPVVRRTR